MSTSIAAPTLDFDHHSVRASHQRDEVLAEVAPHPIFWTEAHGGYWVVASHALAKRVLRDTEVFSSLKTPEMTGGVTIPTMVGPVLIPAEVDPPLLRKLRKVLTPMFHVKAVERLAPQLEQLIVAAVDAAVAKGDFDVVHDIADVIPAGSMMTYLGFPEEERVPFIRSVQTTLDVMPYASDPDFANSPRMAEGMAAMEHALGVIKSLIAARRVHPVDDVVSHLVKPEFELDDDTVMWMVFTLVMGGAENPAATIENSMLYLSQDTGLRARLAADHSLIPAAVEELLRQTSSAVSLARTVTRDIEIEGLQLRAGDRVLLWLPGANRDPRVFDRPAEVDIERSPNPHIAFSDGPHVCVGAQLFRTYFHMLLREILTKMPDYAIELENSVRFDDAATMWGWRTMPALANR